MSKITAGQVTIDLGAESITLLPTLDAVTKISRQFGGLDPATKRVLALDIDAHALIIAAGGGVKNAQALPSKIWAHGIDRNVGPLVDYLLILRNGGRPLADEGDGNEAAEGNGES